MLARHGILGPSLSHLNKVDKAALALFETSNDGLMWEFREVLVLNHEIVQVVPQIVSTGSSSMTIENAEEANLRPLNVEVLLALGLEYVEDNRNTVLIVITDDALICICCIGLNHATFLLRSFRRLVIFQEKSFRIKHRRVLSEKQSLHLDKLDVGILGVSTGET